MNSIKDISQYISGFVLDRIEQNQVVSMHWMTAEIMQNFTDISGSDVDFYMLCAKYYVSDQVKRVIGKFEPSETNSQQLTMKGFNHLQRAYPVMRDNDRVLVPTNQLTRDELLARASEYDSMAEGCRAHAQELRGYAELLVEAG